MLVVAGDRFTHPFNDGLWYICKILGPVIKSKGWYWAEYEDGEILKLNPSYDGVQRVHDVIREAKTVKDRHGESYHMLRDKRMDTPLEDGELCDDSAPPPSYDGARTQTANGNKTVNRDGRDENDHLSIGDRVEMTFYDKKCYYGTVQRMMCDHGDKCEVLFDEKGMHLVNTVALHKRGEICDADLPNPYVFNVDAAAGQNAQRVSISDAVKELGLACSTRADSILREERSFLEGRSAKIARRNPRKSARQAERLGRSWPVFD